MNGTNQDPAFADAGSTDVGARKRTSDADAASPSSRSRSGDIASYAREAHRVVDWTAEYLGQSEQYPVMSQVMPGETGALMPSSPPWEPLGMEGTNQEIERVVLPAVTHWNSPRFMAYFATTAAPPAIIGELYAAALNQNALVWQTSPAIHEIEPVVLDWLRQMIGLPEDLFGIIYDTASISTICAVAAARVRVLPDIGSTGLSGATPLRLYCSAEAHSSVDKAAMILGVGRDNVHKVPCDDTFRMIPEALDEAIQQDRTAGYLPFCVVATVGTTSTTSIDPVPEIAAIANRYDLWLHVDAAYAGSSAILPEMRWIVEGWEQADSVCLNPHKWLFVPLDLSAFYTRDPESLKRAFTYVKPYLETDHDENVVNLSDYGPQLGRRFRGLKLWFVIRAYGVKGLQEIIRGHIALARELEAWVDIQADFELMAPRPFSTVCFRAHPRGWNVADLARLNADLMRYVNASGDAFISHTIAGGAYMLRAAIGNMWTERCHIQRLQELLVEGLAELTC